MEPLNLREALYFEVKAYTVATVLYDLKSKGVNNYSSSDRELLKELVYKIFVNPGEPRKGPFGDREIGSGSEQQIIQDIQSAIDSGFSKIVVRYRGDSSEEQMVQIERFADTIIPNL